MQYTSATACQSFVSDSSGSQLSIASPSLLIVRITRAVLGLVFFVAED